jgi:DNA invertase Pin-like site-specific DNA recombinase
MKTKRCCLYLRVSTDEQSTNMQERELRTFANRRGWKIHRVYSDHGASGGDDKRPALTQLLSDCRSGKHEIEVVLVWKFDRFGRSLRQLVDALELLRSLKIDFVSATEALDTSAPHGELLFQVIAALAQWERALIRQRVRAGLLNAKKSGKRLGRPPLDMPPERINEIRQLRRKGNMPFRALAKKFGVSV